MSQRANQYAAPPRYGSRSHRLRPQTAEPRIPPPPLLPQILTNFVNELPPPNLWASSLLSYFVIDPLIGITRMLIELSVNPRVHRFVLRIGVLSAIFWSAFILAIISYVGFYRAWVPDIGIENQVWLQYGYDRPPFATLDLTSGDGRSSVFAEDQKYDVSLDLVVPLSAANIDLGNFMVSLELTSPLNNTVHYVSKPTILIHESAPIRAMNNLAFQLTRNAPAILIPPTSSVPVQLITIPLLRKVVMQPPNAARPFARSEGQSVVKAHISVGRQDSLKYWMYGGGHGVGGVIKESGGIMRAAAGGEGFRSRGELQTHSASLRFDAHLTGLRYFMYHHPVASLYLFTSLFMFFELVSALTLWALAALYTSSLTQPSLAVEDNYTGGMYGTSDESDTTMRGGRRSGRGGREGQEEESESITVTEPESEGESNAQTQSLASLQARDAQEQYEARRAEEMRNETEGRRMTAVDEPRRGSGLDDLLAQGRRVLGRLDEETEEETDVARSEARSEGSIGWEEVGDAEMQQQEGEEGNDTLGGLRRRKGDPSSQRESTIGGSSTSRASSSARSYGLTSFGGTTSRAPSSTAPSTVVSRSQTEATPEVKEEEESTPEGDSESTDSR